MMPNAKILICRMPVFLEQLSGLTTTEIFANFSWRISSQDPCPASASVATPPLQPAVPQALGCSHERSGIQTPLAGPQEHLWPWLLNVILADHFGGCLVCIAVDQPSVTVTPHALPTGERQCGALGLLYRSPCQGNPMKEEVRQGICERLFLGGSCWSRVQPPGTAGLQLLRQNYYLSV